MIDFDRHSQFLCCCLGKTLWSWLESELVEAAIGQGQRLLSCIKDRGYLQSNFYRLHLAYFIVTILVSSVIVYGSGVDGNSHDAEALFRLRYIDALFLCTSALTNTGLNTVNLSDITAFQQAVLAVLILLGNVVIVSTVTVFIRRHFFKQHIKDFLHHSEAGRHLVDDVNQERETKDQNTSDTVLMQRGKEATTPQSRSSNRGDPVNHHERGHGGFPYPWETNSFRSLASKFGASGPSQAVDHHYLTFQPSLDSKVFRLAHLVSVAACRLNVSRVASVL